MSGAQLLTSVQMANFVASGFLRFDGIVDDATNKEAMTALEAGCPVSSPAHRCHRRTSTSRR